MDFTTLIPPFISALFSAVIGAVVGAVVVKLKTVRSDAERERRDAIELKEMIRQNMLMTCRLTIYDDHFSVDEKLEAYVLYRDTCHGNHQTKKYMDDLVGCDVDEYLEKHKR